jgi:hypothetical protein
MAGDYRCGAAVEDSGKFVADHVLAAKRAAWNPAAAERGGARHARRQGRE